VSRIANDAIKRSSMARRGSQCSHLAPRDIVSRSETGTIEKTSHFFAEFGRALRYVEVEGASAAACLA
jgi:hypothetical protein